MSSLLKYFNNILDLFILTIMNAVVFPQKIILFSVNSLTGEKTTWTFATLLHKWINILNIKLSFHIETKIKKKM